MRYGSSSRAAASTAVTAAGSGDNTVITGVTTDRTALGKPQKAYLHIGYTTTLAQDKTMTFKDVVIQHSVNSNMSPSANYKVLEDGTGTVIETGGTGGTTNVGNKKYEVYIGGSSRYFRCVATPDLNASGTDTANLELDWVFGDFPVYPAP